jgi:hypothetical protein
MNNVVLGTADLSIEDVENAEDKHTRKRVLAALRRLDGIWVIMR